MLFCWLLVALCGGGTTLSGQLPYFDYEPFKRSMRAQNPELIFADQLGRLWVGTQKGIYQMTVNGPVNTPLPDERSLSVTALYQTRNGVVWAGFANGEIAFFDWGHWTYWQPEEGAPSQRISGFAEDHRGQLWISTYGEGLYCWASNQRLYHFGATDGLEHPEIYTLSADGQGSIWAGTDAGVYICAFENGNKRIERLRSLDGLPDEIILSLEPSATGMWIGTHEAGAIHYELESRSFGTAINGANAGPVVGFAKGIEEELYFLSQTGALFRSQSGRVRQLDLVFGPRNRLRSTTRDTDGNLWVLTKEGLFAANLRFEFLDPGVENIQSLTVLEDTTIYLGTSQGVFRGDAVGEVPFQPVWGQSGENIISTHGVSITSATGEKKELVLLGTFGNGLLICQSENCRRIGATNGLTNGNILAIDHDADSIWLASLGGVFSLAISDLSNANPSVNSVGELGDGFIYQVQCAYDGAVWVASDGDGLARYGKGQLTVYDSLSGVDGFKELSTILSISQAGTDAWWINSQEYGVLKLTNGKVATLAEDIRQVSGDEEISAIAQDRHGRLLVVHPQGASLYLSKEEHWLTFGAESGFNSGGAALNAITKAADGSIWFVAGNQLVRYRAAEELNKKPYTKLEFFAANGALVPKETQKLSHDQNFLVFHYRANTLNGQGEVQYRYLLEGHDQDWIETTDEQATYSNLAPGHYVFEVESGLNGQFSGRPDTLYAFEILKPWWLRWWAVVLFIIGAVSLFWLLLEWQRRRKSTLLLLEKEKVDNELAALKAQINPHFLFNSFSTLIAAIEQSPQSGIEYAQQLSDFFRRVLSLKDSNLIPLVEEMDLARNYFYLLRKRFGDKLNLDFEVAKNSGSLPPMSLQILIENAVKHNLASRRQPLTITITRQQNFLIVSNPIQPKIMAETSTGFGLDAIRRRYHLLGIEDNVEVKRENGCFVVCLPLLGLPGTH